MHAAHTNGRMLALQRELAANIRPGNPVLRIAAGRARAALRRREPLGLPGQARTSVWADARTAVDRVAEHVRPRPASFSKRQKSSC